MALKKDLDALTAKEAMAEKAFRKRKRLVTAVEEKEFCRLRRGALPPRRSRMSFLT